MSKCIVKQYGVAVNNADLPYAGALVLEIKASTESNVNDGINIIANGSEPLKLKAVGGTFSVNGVSYTEYTPELTQYGSYNVTLSVQNVDYKIIIFGAKYTLMDINTIFNSSKNSYPSIIGFNLDDMSFTPVRSLLFSFSINNNNIKGLLQLKDVAVLNNINMSAPNGGVNLDSLEGSKAITNLQIPYTKSIGSLLSLAENIGLITLNINFTDVAGSIDEFAAAQVAAGRTSGTMRLLALVTPNITCSVEHTDYTKSFTITYDSSYVGGYNITLTP